MVAVIKESVRNPRVMWALGLYCGAIIAYFALSCYFLSHRPNIIDPLSGRTFALRQFGSVAYLTKGEHRFFEVLHFAPYLFLVAAMLINSRELLRGAGMKAQHE